MFYNLIIAIRNLRRNGLYSVINIVGLTVSLATCILISLWVHDELSFDRFHKNKDHLFLVNSSIDSENFFSNTPAGLSVRAKEEIPEIKNACRISWYTFSYFMYNDQQFLTNNSIHRGAAVDSSFFSMFSFPLIDGDAQKPFTGDFSIVLSETMAKSIFGDENPMGKAVKTSWGNDFFYVTGIMKDMPVSSSIRYDYLTPFSRMKLTYNPGPMPYKTPDEDFANSYSHTFLELYPGTNVQQVEEKLENIMVRELTPYARFFGFSEVPPIKMPLQQITAQHLYNADGSPGGMVQVRLFAIVSFLILVIACINYVNLVTARTGKRSKEMSVRKFLGAKWINIVWLSLQETCVMLASSVFFATMLIYMAMPVYNHISGKNMEFQFFSFHVLIIYGITLVCVLGLAGLYPSFYLASLNKKIIKNRHAPLRKTLVVLQFVCSIVLIVSTLVITMQMNYIRKKDLGYDKENVICFPAWGFAGHIDAVRNELHQNPEIQGTSTSSLGNMINKNYSYGISWQGKDTEKAIKVGLGHADFDFLQVMNIQLLDGQTPPETSDGQYCFLNETAVREMELSDPLNQILTFGNYQYTVSGVVRDFHFDRLNETISPLILVCTKNDRNNNFLYVKTTARGTQSTLASIEKLWKQYCPNLLFTWSFLDENFERLYQTDIRMSTLLYIFAFIAIVISCLGLFGLVTYTAETKTKEIGIRKVLGAKVSDIVSMLSKEYLILAGIAMLIAFPLAYYWLGSMLQNYAYRIEIKWWMFALAGIITIALTLFTVGWKAIKAATENPVKAIKSE